MKKIIYILLNQLRALTDRIRIRVNPVRYARSLGVKVGNDVRLINIRPADGTFGSEPYLIEIGNHVTLAAGVQFVNHDGGVWIFRDKHPDIDVFGKIIVGDNVFIGYNAIIMPGVEIGNNSVIGAGSVVTKNIPSNSVAVGNPAKVIKTSKDYFEAIIDKADFVRGLNVMHKKAYLLEKYR